MIGVDDPLFFKLVNNPEYFSYAGAINPAICFGRNGKGDIQAGHTGSLADDAFEVYCEYLFAVKLASWTW